MIEPITSTLLLALAVWLTPLPQHAEGKLIYYGSQNLVQANADWRGYDLAPYFDECGVAVMSPSDLGRIVWLRAPGFDWYGPCLAVDVAKRSDFLRYVNHFHSVAEVGDRVRDYFGFEFGVDGEVWVGACPPPEASAPHPYRVEPAFSNEPHLCFCTPYPPQEWPTDCRVRQKIERRGGP